MKQKKYNGIRSVVAAIFLIILFSGCSDYLENPLKDKNTGEDINLLILDFNFFNTRMTCKFLDASNGSIITAPARVRFLGKNGEDIVTFSGEKKPEFNTTQGQLELAVDPNTVLSEDNPFQFAVEVEVEGYNTLTKGFQLRSEGKKTFELNLSKTADEETTDLEGKIDYSDGDTTIIFSAHYTPSLKSAESSNYQINYWIYWDDLLRFKDASGNLLFSSSREALDALDADPDNFFNMNFSKYSDYASEIDVVYIEDDPFSVLFHKLETGRLNHLIINGTEVADLNGGLINSKCSYNSTPVPGIFGFAVFAEEGWNILGTETSYNHLDFNYTLVKASPENLCGKGSKITFISDVVSSFSIDADVYDMEDQLLTTLNFKGSFPDTFTIENTPQKAVRLVFRNNNPAFKPIPALVIDNFCLGSYEVAVEPQENYEEYQIVLKAYCPDNMGVAVAPTYSGEFRLTNSDNPWQGVDMNSGVIDLLALTGEEYEIRLLWENDWEYTTITTEFDDEGNYLHPGESDIHSEILDDGRIRIKIEHQFSQNVCDNMGW